MSPYLPLALLGVVFAPLIVFTVRLFVSSFKRDRWTR